MSTDWSMFDVKKYDAILAKGLCAGLGIRGQQVCIEAAICQTLDLPHDDNPVCVGHAVRAFKIALNDGFWSSPTARASGLRDLGIAQLGSDDLDQVEFSKKLVEKSIRVLLPDLFRTLFPKNTVCLAAADKCEKEGSANAVYAAYAAYAAAYNAEAADAAEAAYTAAYAADAAAYNAEAADAANAAAYVAYATKAANAAINAEHTTNQAADYYLRMAARLALEVLREMKSPGIALLEETK